jgi:hypothetical protein
LVLTEGSKFVTRNTQLPARGMRRAPGCRAARAVYISPRPLQSPAGRTRLY